MPVLALQGCNFAGRVNGVLLRAAGLPALVQPDTAAYVARAVQVLTDTATRATLGHFLREQVPRSDLFNACDTTRQFEVAYRHALDLALAGKPPESMMLRLRTPLAQPVYAWPADALC